MRLLLILTLFLSSVFGWVGEITALKGKADVIRKTNILPAKIGFKLEKNDQIKTFDKTKMQIIFKDNTVITIGKNSKVKIADYLFDNENSTAKFKLSHGIMKTLTGKIGKFAPKRFKVLTKNASIGIRGTYFVVESYDNVVKLGMIAGVTEFTNLENMKTFTVTKGEQLVFDEKIKDVKIKKNFVEPDAVKLTPTTKETQQPTPPIVDNIESTIQTVEEKQNEVIKNVTQDKIIENKGTFTKFIEGLF